MASQIDRPSSVFVVIFNHHTLSSHTITLIPTLWRNVCSLINLPRGQCQKQQNFNNFSPVLRINREGAVSSCFPFTLLRKKFVPLFVSRPASSRITLLSWFIESDGNFVGVRHAPVQFSKGIGSSAQLKPQKQKESQSVSDFKSQKNLLQFGGECRDSPDRWQKERELLRWDGARKPLTKSVHLVKSCGWSAEWILKCRQPVLWRSSLWKGFLFCVKASRVMPTQSVWSKKLLVYTLLKRS